MTLDPRVLSVPGDARLGRPILKATHRGPKVIGRMPTQAEIDAERPFWGPHPDPDVARIEEAYYQFGARFLAQLYGHVLGRTTTPRALRKAGAAAAGWGEIARLWRDPNLSVDQAMDGWTRVIERLSRSLFDPAKAESEAQALALRSHLLWRLGEKAKAGTLLPSWEEATRGLSRAAHESMAWTKARAAEYVTGLHEQALHALRQALVDSRQAKEGVSKLQQRLFDKFSAQNRDWRRVALTETGMAVANGQLASVDADTEVWLAKWAAGPKACPFCRAMDRQVFRVLSAPDAKKGATSIWPGKHNVGRAMAAYSKREGRFRTPDERWWPCQPAHPNCACSWTVYRKP